MPDDSAGHRVPLAQAMGSAAPSRAFPFAGSRPGRDAAIGAGCAGQPQPMACTSLKEYSRAFRRGFAAAGQEEQMRQHQGVRIVEMFSCGTIQIIKFLPLACPTPRSWTACCARGPRG